MVFYNFLDSAMASLSSALWSMPLVILLLGGGIFFSIYSRLTPLLYFKHAIQVLMGKYDSDDAPGQITHFEALSSALAGTVGMGNIAGVAVAIHTGGPGAIFWMWVTAVLGMSTKFFTCTLALMYRAPSSASAADDITALIICAMFRMLPLFGGTSSFLDR